MRSWWHRASRLLLTNMKLSIVFQKILQGSYFVHRGLDRRSRPASACIIHRYRDCAMTDLRGRRNETISRNGGRERKKVTDCCDIKSKSGQYFDRWKGHSIKLLFSAHTRRAFLSLCIRIMVPFGGLWTRILPHNWGRNWTIFAPLGRALLRL